MPRADQLTITTDEEKVAVLELMFEMREMMNLRKRDKDYQIDNQRVRRIRAVLKKLDNIFIPF